MRPLAIACLLIAGCGSDSKDEANTTCPSAAGTWTVSNHCDASLIGLSAAVTQQGCTLSFAAPFNAFTGQVAADGKVSLSGPQTCTGTLADDTIELACTPGTCPVVLTR